ncbi:MAG TPA: N-acetylglucosamine-6-phosphate deacetylase [Vicinamibacterales bacterium]
MMVLSGADVVLANRILSPGTLIVDAERIVNIVPAARPPSPGVVHVDLAKHYVVPGFIDVHVHGVQGFDTLDGGTGLKAMASRLPAYGVTAFCPTTVACEPPVLARFLNQLRRLRTDERVHGARILPAHLESNFINPEYRGAQPAACLRRPPTQESGSGAPKQRRSNSDFDADDLLNEIDRGKEEVGTITLAPELEGALALIDRFVAAGHRVSLGHSGATFDQAKEAVAHGARGATHLFNRMPPVGHRDPGLAAAVLVTDELAAELICDGFHVHPAILQVAIASKSLERVMAITDATGGAGLPMGTRARLGDQLITVGEAAAYLDDGTLAGSILTMDRAFAMLVNQVGLALPEAVMMCSTTPARELGLQGMGLLTEGGLADLTVLDRNFRVVQTYVGGLLVYQR